MEVYRRSSGLLLLLGLTLLATTLQGVQGEVESEGPSESECRPYIEKALKELEAGEVAVGSSELGDSKEDLPTVEITDDSYHREGDGEKDDANEDGHDSNENEIVTEKKIEPEVRHSFLQKLSSFFQKLFQKTPSKKEEAANENKRAEDKQDDASQEQDDQPTVSSKEGDSKEDDTQKDEPSAEEGDKDDDSKEDDRKVDDDSKENDGKVDAEDKDDSKEEQEAAESDEQTKEEVDEKVDADDKDESKEEPNEDDGKSEEQKESVEEVVEEKEEETLTQSPDEQDNDSKESIEQPQGDQPQESREDTKDDDSKEDDAKDDSKEEDAKEDDTKVDDKSDEQDDDKNETQEDTKDDSKEEAKGDDKDSQEDDQKSQEADKSDEKEDADDKDGDTKEESVEDDGKKDDDSKEKVDVSKEDDKDDDKEESKEDKDAKSAEEDKESNEKVDNKDEDDDDSEEIDRENGGPVEDLSLDTDIPTNLRDRGHVEQLLKLDDDSSETESVINRVSEITLRDLKKLYENAIKPLETVYKYRDLSNRHFGDSEIFSKPLILFMGPWSGGKSTIINYLTNNEFNETSLRTGAEPSPAYFNILMYGDEPEIIEGTEIAADFTFSGLQKFGQGLEERLRGIKLPSKLLEKVNIVEIPGILEVRKQVSRVFPFNDACQWFIDRADVIFLVYDPSKLDVGPETEAILDQLKGREHQTRIILNKADQVKPEELMRVQGALIWNISPLMSSPQPPIMYTTSLWSRPYESWAPVRLLQAQERSFLRDIRGAIDKRIENKIASARRFAVRVRNHAKMVDCYLTTYYNHKSVFGNRKQVADAIIEHPQDYHIYEGLSTLTNISRYDLPDPDVYRDFFKLNPLYEFQQLSATCTYFRGCPINRLDIAIAYDLPELLGTHKKRIENALSEAANGSQQSAPGS